MEHSHTKQKSVCFNFFYHAPQESCLFCAHCHIPPGDFETVARQDGPVFGLTSQSSTGGSHRLDRGGCLPDRWSSGFRNYGASEELWTLSSIICWYLWHLTVKVALFSSPPCNKCSGKILSLGSDFFTELNRTASLTSRSKLSSFLGLFHCANYLVFEYVFQNSFCIPGGIWKPF